MARLTRTHGDQQVQAVDIMVIPAINETLIATPVEADKPAENTDALKAAEESVNE